MKLFTTSLLLAFLATSALSQEIEIRNRVDQCSLQETVLQTNINGADLYAWKIENANGDSLWGSDERNPTYTWPRVGKFTIRLKVKDEANSIDGSTSKQVDVALSPQAMLEVSTIFNVATLFNKSIIEGKSEKDMNFDWDWDDNSENQFSQQFNDSVIHTYPEKNATYRPLLTARYNPDNGVGCTDTMSVQVVVYNEAWETSIDELENPWNAGIFPNPIASDSRLSFELTKTEQVTIAVYNQAGQIMWNEVSNRAGGLHNVELGRMLEGASAGNYVVSLSSQEVVYFLHIHKD